ncbi:hypothetical protein FVF58_17350 [Paraburkholderia panacisoli]|uniref:Uncharacterized protein n=1 Tax=Paraburkholderia panacisoli TaxID=2603818 RepID=A0A5B0H7N7_9BURK|nr:hypothetical protein FVF58_17350 [Paraburkholderia panacisoli]
MLRWKKRRHSRSAFPGKDPNGTNVVGTFVPIAFAQVSCGVNSERLASDNEGFRSLTAVAKGVPSNLRNEKGDSLAMLASYHRHVDAVGQWLIFSGAATHH